MQTAAQIRRVKCDNFFPIWNRRSRFGMNSMSFLVDL